MLSPALRILLFAVPFSVRRMFFMGEPGLHLEAITPEQNAVNPTMFQDSAGTTPITAIEQPVGLWLDTKNGGSLGGELVPSTNWSGGSVPGPPGISVPVGWTTYSAVNITAMAVAPNSLTFTATAHLAGIDSGATMASINGKFLLFRIRARKTAEVSGTPSLRVYSGAWNQVVPAGAVVGQWFTKEFRVKATTTAVILSNFNGAASWEIEFLSVRELPGNHVSQSSAGARPTYTRRVNLLNATATLSTQNVTTVAASYKLSFTGTGTVTLSGTSTAGPLVGTGASDLVSLTFTATDGTLTLTVSGSVTLADLRPSNIAALNIPAYQRVTSSTDYDTEGFPPMVKGNGTSQWMSGTLDMSAANQLLITAGVTKYSDAAQAIICELTASAAANNGGFALCAPAAGSATYSGLSRGSATATATTGTTHASPKPAVVTMQANIAADVMTLNVNGVDDGTSATDQGSGNYANSTLYLFSRGGSSLWSSAGVTSLTIRGGDGSTWASRLRNYVKNLMRLVY